MTSTEKSTKQEELIPINYKDRNKSHFRTKDDRYSAWEESLKNPDRFWGNFAKKNVDWFAPFDRVRSGTFLKGDIGWFLNGKLNISYNCIDRWVKYKPDAIAIIWEGNEPDMVEKITYKQVQEEVCKMANVLKRHGVRKGDIVVIYMPMIPQAAFAMLACARIGAAHSVIFAGFGSDAIKDRIIDADAKYVITANEQLRGSKKIDLMNVVNKGLSTIKTIKRVFVYPRTDSKFEDKMLNENYYNLKLEMNKERPYCPCEVMDSEDILFLLYTSGSTGKPKGVVHTTGGYLVWTMATHRYVFDVQPGDVYACVADVGWITGHSYIVYGPLANGSTTFMFESTPMYPNCGRYWDMIQRHKITQFYTAPTAIRALMKYPDENVLKYDRSSLKVLGTVGEPINPEPWLWYYKIVGDSKCPIVDTYWQTETGGIMLTPLPGCTDLKPGSCTLPFFGIEPAILDKNNNFKEIELKSGMWGYDLYSDNDDMDSDDNTKDTKDSKDSNENKQDDSNNTQSGILVIKRPWPGMARTVYGNHERYLNTYMTPYPGYYLTGDGAKRDKDGYYWITGRIDDVINVSGHRIGSGEVENAVVEQDGIAEAAVVGIPHETKGSCLFVYAITKQGVTKDENLKKSVKNIVRTKIGPFCTPDYVMLVDGLPKTRSGKIVRRVLRKIGEQEYDRLGDITTVGNPDCVKQLIQLRKNLKS